MAANFQQVKTYTIKPEYFFDELRNPYFAQALNIEMKSENYTPGGLWFRFHHGVSFSSWGEKITITVVVLQGGITQVTVHSECGMPTQVFDWGKNSSNVTAIFNQLEAAVFARYNQDMYARNQAANSKCFCTKCGTQMLRSDKFCVKCGAPNK
jgi:hypothetical protein